MLSYTALCSIRRVSPHSVRQNSSFLKFFSSNSGRSTKSLIKRNFPAFGYDQIRDNSNGKELVHRKSSESGSEVSTSVKEVLKETTKTASYTVVILAGVGLTSLLFYLIFRELFSSKSPNSVYARTLKKCVEDTRVSDALGEPIKGFGEETRRGRRRHVSYKVYDKNGVPHMRMKFYLKGSRNSATVQLEVKEDETGKYIYNFIFVQLKDFPHRIIVLEDNRKGFSSILSRSKAMLDVMK